MKENDPVILTWGELFKSWRAWCLIAFCLLALSIIIFYLPSFYNDVIGPKHGILIHDVVLNLFTPVNWSVPTFTIIYLSILQTFFSIVRKPQEILIALSTYLAVNLLRMVAMYALTFEPPADTILLVDPVTSHFYPSGGFAKDLFFSGHISTMTLMILLEKNRVLRIVKICGAVVVALFLVWQHVHYSLDILVAPFVTIGVYTSIRFFLKPAFRG